jgi:D-tyrosyl-tRNA(Tyr) deacylase
VGAAARRRLARRGGRRPPLSPLRVLLQRVARAEVRVGGRQVGRIGRGLVALVGIGQEDTPATAEKMAASVANLRIFGDEAGKTNRSLLDVHGEVLAVSQFTLYAETSRGRRPSFIRAARPELADQLYETFAAGLQAMGVTIARGVFGAEMEVELVNDGPMTIWLDSAG